MAIGAARASVVGLVLRRHDVGAFMRIVIGLLGARG
jgi:hypothetical protein